MSKHSQSKLFKITTAIILILLTIIMITNITYASNINETQDNIEINSFDNNNPDQEIKTVETTEDDKKDITNKNTSQNIQKETPYKNTTNINKKTNTNINKNENKTVKKNERYVSNFLDLKYAIENIKSNAYEEMEIIYLKKGDYKQVEELTWGDTNKITKTLVIAGNNQTIDGYDYFRFIRVYPGYVLYLQDATFTNFNQDEGALVYNDHGHVIFQNITVKNSHAKHGGVSYNNKGRLEFINSTFINNTAENGGVNYNIITYDAQVRVEQVLSIKNCTFINNKATNNGGVNYNTKEHLIQKETNKIVIEDSVFTNNSALRGGVNYNTLHDGSIDDDCDPATNIIILKNSTFTNNNAEYGGVNYNFKSYMQTENSTFIENWAKNGGVNYNTQNSTSIINNTKFKYNHVTTKGGVTYNNKSTIIINNSYLQNNLATTGTGGNIYNEGNLTLTNNMFANYYVETDRKLMTRTNITMKNNTMLTYINATLNKPVELNSPIINVQLPTSEFVEFIIDGKTIKTNKNEENYKVGVNYTFTKGGKYNISIIYQALSKDNNIISLIVNIDKMNQTLNINIPEKIKSKTNLTLHGNITDDNGNIITSNSKIAVKINDVTQKVITINNGIINITLKTDNFSAKTYKLTIILGENYRYYEKRIIENFTIEKRSCTMAISINKPTTLDNIIATVNLGDDKNNVLTGGYVIFKINGCTLKDTNGKTLKIYANDLGSVLLKYKIPSTIGSGNYTLQCIYTNTYYKTIKLSIHLEILKKEVPQVKLETINTSMVENTTINIKVYDANKTQLVGKIPVVIKINGITQFRTTMENGVLNIKIPTNNFSAKKYNLTIVLGYNALYEKSYINGIINIKNTSQVKKDANITIKN